jgi:hypothetical protein
MEICLGFCGSRGTNNGINTRTKRIITETEVTRDQHFKQEVDVGL